MHGGRGNHRGSFDVFSEDVGWSLWFHSERAGEGYEMPEGRSRMVVDAWGVSMLVGHAWRVAELVGLPWELPELVGCALGLPKLIGHA